jgi:nucleotide-binding universal stress UspA family protein
VDAVHSIGYLLGGGGVLAQACVQAWRDARRLERELIRDGSLVGIEHEFLILDDPPAMAISQVAVEKNVDLIVIGTHGRHGLTKLLLGSCAETVLRSASCPVLTVGAWTWHPSSANLGPRHVLLLTDFSAVSKTTAEYALSLARHSGAELIALHVIEENGATTSKPSRVVEDMTRQLSYGLGSVKLGQVKPQVQVWTGPLPRTIQEVERQVGADLLVMTVDRRSKGHLRVPTAYEVICESECPVLTIPTEERSGYERHDSMGN